MRIIDSHAHLDVKGYTVTPSYAAEYGQEKWRQVQSMSAPMREKWRKAWRFPEREEAEGDIARIASRWLSDMDAKGVERMVFVTCGSNELASELIAIAPDRFSAYAHHDICAPDAAEALERAITRQGLCGYKLFAPLIDTPLGDRALEPVWEVAERHEIPVLIHFGILGGAGGIADHINISPMSLHGVAKAHPRIPFIVPHFGCGHPRDALFLAWACPNVYIDTSGSNQWTRFMPYPLTVRDLILKFTQTIGASRVLFGTDSEWFPRGFVSRYFESQLRDCVELGLPDSDIELIFGGNAARLLKL